MTTKTYAPKTHHRNPGGPRGRVVHYAPGVINSKTRYACGGIHAEVKLYSARAEEVTCDGCKGKM